MAHTPTIAHNQPNIRSIIQQDGQAAIVPLKLIAHLQGQLVDVVDLTFTIRTDPGDVQVFPAAGEQAIDFAQFFPSGDKLSRGRYAPRWTPADTITAGDHKVRYKFKYATGGTEHTLEQSFKLIAESTAVDREADALAIFTGLYCTEGDVRDEGFNDSARWKKKRIDKLIKKWSRRIERWTGRWFEPRIMVMFLDGTGDRALEVPAPIIEIHEVRILSRGLDTVTSEVVADGDILIYNRHMSQRLIGEDDDREDPRIEFVHHSGSLRGGTEFPPGSQNVQIAGIFGYTDPNPSSVTPAIQQYGEIPEDLRDVVVALVVRDLFERIDWEDREDAQKRGQLKSQKHGDDKVEVYQDPRPALLTGDAELDTQILQFRRPMGIAHGGGVQFTIDRVPLDTYTSGGLVGVG